MLYPFMIPVRLSDSTRLTFNIAGVVRGDQQHKDVRALRPI